MKRTFRFWPAIAMLGTSFVVYACKERQSSSQALAEESGDCSNATAKADAEEAKPKFVNNASPDVDGEEVLFLVEVGNCNAFWVHSVLGLVRFAVEPAPQCGVQVSFSKKEALTAFALAANGFAREKGDYGPVIEVSGGHKVPVCGILGNFK